MGDHKQTTDDQHDSPLFKQMDEQERIYAPQQVPGALPDDREQTEPVVPGTVSTAIDTPIPGAKAIDTDLDRQADERSRR